MKPIRFILIGGFLGAGKTTLVARLASHYVAQGKRVAIVTNDQAADLVDTHTLRSQGFDVGEVAGACFCCSFDDLLETAERFRRDRAPDVILAEPVGSCTDLVATVLMPLEQLYGRGFATAPFGVLLKPSHGRRILGVSGPDGRSGFSPQAEYIFRKQLEEADYLMLGRADELSDEDVRALEEAVRKVAPRVPVLAVSPKTGQGLEDVLAQIETSTSDSASPRRTLDIDYDIYAAGEAELGWVNLTAVLTGDYDLAAVDLDRLAEDIARQCGAELAALPDAEVAHLKCIAMADQAQAVANLVSSDGGIDRALAAERAVAGPVRVVVNARVAVEPEMLEKICRRAVATAASDQGLIATEISARALRPGRPVPTHRMGAT